MENKIKQAAELIRNSKYTVAFTGAGISVESGIPPFRGETGLWSKYDPIVLDLNYFFTESLSSWEVIRELFYDFFGKAKPNKAHQVLSKLERAGLLKSIITQNIDNLHQEAGSNEVYEFHGTAQKLVCTHCATKYDAKDIDLRNLPPLCPKDSALLKPDFIFFGEGIPETAYSKSIKAANEAEVFIIIGTTGEIVPASSIPHLAKEKGARIIEINVEESNFTNTITDIFLKGKAGDVFAQLDEFIFNRK